MNKQKLSEMRGKRIRIRPIARRIDPNGFELPQVDDLWSLTETSRTELTLANQRTYHNVQIGTDHVHEYRTDIGNTDGILILKSQIFLFANGLAVEPLIT